MANKLLGQHFLNAPDVVEKIIQAIDPAAGEIIFEVGPGHGELTLPLARVCRDRGCTIITIEKDGELATALEKKLAEENLTKEVRVVAEDALAFFKTGAKFKRTIKDVKQFKIVGNIPYYVSGHLLRIVSEMDQKPARAVFMLQKEVAERVTARAGDMSRLAASVQFWARPEIAIHVPKENFSPQPKIDSAVVIFEALADPNDRLVPAKRYYDVLRGLFAQPRKTLLNNMSAYLGHTNKNLDKMGVDSLLRSARVDPGARPQALTIENIIAIAKATSPGRSSEESK